MEIIEHGNTSKKQTCNNCKCIFIYTRKDINYYGSAKEVRCPECENCITIEQI